MDKAESALRNYEVIRYSNASQHFSKPEGSLPCSQQAATYPCLESEKSLPHPPILIKMHSNITLIQKFRSSKATPPFRFSHYKPARLSALPHTCHMSLHFIHLHFIARIMSPEEFYIHGSVHRESNLITVQQDATYSVYYISVGSSTCFGC